MPCVNIEKKFLSHKIMFKFMKSTNHGKCFPFDGGVVFFSLFNSLKVYVIG